MNNMGFGTGYIEYLVELAAAELSHIYYARVGR